MSTSIQLFDFNGSELRFVGTPERPEWVARDILAILYPNADDRNYYNYLQKVPDKWKCHKPVMTVRGEKDMVTLLEPGFYFVLGRSDSSIAIPFQDWLYEEVLPSIRKTGGYSTRSQQALDREQLKLQQVIERGDRRIQAEQLRLQRIQATKEVLELRIAMRAKGIYTGVAIISTEDKIAHINQVIEAIALTPDPNAKTPVKEIWTAIERHYIHQGILSVNGRARAWLGGWYIKGANQVPTALHLAVDAKKLSIGNNRMAIAGFTLNH